MGLAYLDMELQLPCKASARVLGNVIGWETKENAQENWDLGVDVKKNLVRNIQVSSKNKHLPQDGKMYFRFREITRKSTQANC